MAVVMWVQERTNNGLAKLKKAKRDAEERPVYLTLLILALLAVVGISVWHAVSSKPASIKVSPVTVQHQADKPVSPMTVNEQVQHGEDIQSDLPGVYPESVGNEPGQSSSSQADPSDSEDDRVVDPTPQKILPGAKGLWVNPDKVVPGSR